jgi:phytoene dehydrogenase-like protein
VIALAEWTGVQAIASHAAALSFAGLGATCLLTVALRKPWTADYSRIEYQASAESPIFVAINMALSAMWGVLFLLIAAARATHAGTAVIAIIVGSGTIASVFGPRVLMRWGARRHLAARETYRWPAPALRSAKGNGDFDVAVVGAGIGGLTAAALLADAGMRVLVAEQHVVPGGFCHTFLRKAHHAGKPCLYRFDAGAHDFSGLWRGGPVDSVLRRLGVAASIDWCRLDHTYRLRDLTIDVPRDWRTYVRELGRRFPASAAGIERLFADVRAIFDGMYSTGEANGGVPGSPDTVDALLAFPRRHPLAFHWLERPFAELLAKHVPDADARRILTMLTGYLGDGSEVLSCRQMVPIFGYYFHGGFYPRGGSGRLAEALVEAIESRGGTVRCKAGVRRITIERGRASGIGLENGERIRTGAVVCNGDIKRTLLDLVAPEHLPAYFRRHLTAAAPATSAFMVHLGVDFVPEIRPAVHVSGACPVGITCLSLVDPTAAPPGHATLGIFTLTPHADATGWFPADEEGPWTHWRRSHEYAARKQALGDRLVAAAEAVVPGLSRHIVYRSDATPVTYARYAWTSAGSIYGVSRDGRPKGAKSPLPGLVVAGSATHGAGVEAAVISGAWAADALVPGLLRHSPASITPPRLSEDMATA